MLSNNQIDEVLDTTTEVMERIAELTQVTAKATHLSESISQACVLLKSKYDSVTKEVGSLRRLKEVLSSYVFLGNEQPKIPEGCAYCAGTRESESGLPPGSELRGNPAIVSPPAVAGTHF